MYSVAVLHTSHFFSRHISMVDWLIAKGFSIVSLHEFDCCSCKSDSLTTVFNVGVNGHIRFSVSAKISILKNTITTDSINSGKLLILKINDLA